MSQGRSGNRSIVLGVMLLIACAIGAGVYGVLKYRQRPGVTVLPSRGHTEPATQPGTQSTTRRVEAATARTYLDVVKRAYPSLPATRPLETPLDLADAAHVLLREPVYVDSAGHLWITLPEGRTAEQVLGEFGRADFRDQVHVVRERVVYVHWQDDGEGAWRPGLFVREGDGSLRWIRGSGSRPLALKQAYDFSRAFSWNDLIVAPTRSGVGILRLGTEVSEQYQEMLAGEASQATSQPSRLSRPVMVLDTRGLLAFVPAEGGQRGSAGAWRFVDGHWTPLGPEQGWPGQLVHLVPLLDGSVLQIIPDQKGMVRLALAPLEAAAVDQAGVEKLIEQLSDPDPVVRDGASKALSVYGPGIYPLLEQRMAHQPPEGRKRLRQLLANKLKPTLGGMSLIDGRLRCVARFAGGGAVFYAEGGVTLPNAEGSAAGYLTPAWLAILPGRPIETLPGGMVHDLRPDQVRLQYVPTAPPEWVVSDAVHGPQRYIGNRLVALLAPGERMYEQLIAIDAEGRWVFREAEPSAEAGNGAAGTLILDPRLGSLRPRLPGWVMAMGRGAGWDNHDWPVTSDGGGNQWALHESGWRVVNRKSNRMHTRAEEAPAIHWPTSRASTGPATEAAAVPLLVTREGVAYFGGKEAIRIVAPDGSERVYRLPAEAVGPLDRPILLRTGDGLLFLYNAPGRLLRLTLPEKGGSTLALEATFTHNIPNTDAPTRLWLDPAGRICFLDGGRLTLLFPQGRIPPAIRTLMPAEALRAAEEQ